MFRAIMTALVEGKLPETAYGKTDQNLEDALAADFKAVKRNLDLPGTYGL